MTYQYYNKKRWELEDKAEKYIAAGNVDKADAVMDSIKKLDAKLDKQKAMEAEIIATSEPQYKKPDVFTDGEMSIEKEVEKTMATKKTDHKSKEYMTAWAKTMMGAHLTDAEANVFKMVNEYTHTTENTGAVIPDTVASGIWSEVEDMYPYYADITKTSVKGTLTLVKATDTTDAGWYVEDTATEDGEETLETYTLSGCELSRAITVSWKLREMSMDDFIPYIQRRMAERMGAGLGYGITQGAGNTGSGAPEPVGVCTALKAEDGTPQVVTYEDTLTWADVTAARACIKSGYSAGLKCYANSYTIWNILANVVDENKRPIFINDQTAGGVYRVVGVQVVEDASFENGQVLFSNASQGYQANINAEMSVLTEDHVKLRTTDYVSYAIIDGAPISNKAHALLELKSA